MSKVRPAGSPGYTFPIMLIIVAAMAFGAARLELAQSYRVKRDKEEELLFRGQAYMGALRAYYAKNKRYPRQLKELADGGDFSKPRFIRQLYRDPMTGRDFEPILTSKGAVMGVVSSSTELPFQKVNFAKELQGFDKAKTYADWKFEAKPSGAVSPAMTPLAAGGFEPN